MRFNHIALLALPFSFVLAGCPREKSEEPFTRAEAQAALEESSDATEADALASASIEISTNFTLGAALEQAAGEIRSFVESQLPCAEVTLSGATLTVEYGVNPGNCSYRGHEFTGTTTVSVEKNADDQVLVHHEWSAFSNGVIMLDGDADVTWDFAAKERHVVHHAEWTHLASGRTGVGDGDRTQMALDGGIAEGIRIVGTRSWSGARGDWNLGVNGVEMRWADPVPQAGSYTLTTPEDKHLSLDFSRVDADTIAVTLTGPNDRSFTFNVSKL